MLLFGENGVVDESPYVRAPRWRRTLAGLFDAGLIAGAVALVGVRRGGPARAGRWLRLVPAEVVREQLGTPGQHLFGVRTVDRRTGRRVSLWRTALLAAFAAAGQALARKLAPQPAARERESRIISDELDEIRRNAPSAEAQREQMAAFFERHQRPLGREALQPLAATLAAGLLTLRLRRRLAPTVDVLARGRSDHSP